MTVPFLYSLPKGPHHVETIWSLFWHHISNPTLRPNILGFTTQLFSSTKRHLLGFLSWIPTCLMSTVFVLFLSPQTFLTFTINPRVFVSFNYLCHFRTNIELLMVMINSILHDKKLNYYLLINFYFYLKLDVLY